jgi:predicted O-methyltransferase YrrM
VSARLRSTVRGTLVRGVSFFGDLLQRRARRQHDVDLALTQLLGRVEQPDRLADPLAFVELLRGCIEPLAFKVVVLRAERAARDAAGRRFAMLLDVLATAVPPLPAEQALDVARVADRFRTRPEAVAALHQEMDVAWHFAMASSFARTGRLLGAIARFARSRRALELGTAYGMSALFLLEAMQHWSGGGHLTTLEIAELPFALSSTLLAARYGERVRCIRGAMPDALPEALAGIDKIDLVFHDAEHSGSAYVRDFAALLPALAPGSIVVFDDIRWDNRRWVAQPSRTHAGWLQVAGHDSVRSAVEIDGAIGLLLIR